MGVGIELSGGSIVSGLDDMQNQKNALLQEKGQAEGHAKTLRDKAQVSLQPGLDLRQP